MINKKVKNLEDLKAKPANIWTVNEEITGALDPAALLHAAEALEKQVEAYTGLEQESATIREAMEAWKTKQNLLQPPEIEPPPRDPYM